MTSSWPTPGGMLESVTSEGGTAGYSSVGLGGQVGGRRWYWDAYTFNRFRYKYQCNIHNKNKINK